VGASASGRRGGARNPQIPRRGRAVSGRRYYDPSNGRFLGRDPKKEKGGLNLYGFVRNNPVKRWDYLGMTGKDDGDGESDEEEEEDPVIMDPFVVTESHWTDADEAAYQLQLLLDALDENFGNTIDERGDGQSGGDVMGQPRPRGPTNPARTIRDQERALEAAVAAAGKGGKNDQAAYEAAQRALAAFRAANGLRPPGSPGDAAFTGPSPLDLVRAAGNPGNSSGVRLVSSEAALNDLFRVLSQGGTIVPNSSYPGTWVRLPNGSFVGIRPVSQSGGATIDFNAPGVGIFKVHIAPPPPPPPPPATTPAPNP
jgi:hypothetical protein